VKGQGWGQTLGLTPVGWFGFIGGLYDVVPNVEMRGRALLRSVSVKLAELRRTVRRCAKCRNERVDSPANVLGGWIK
jgi:hypothetical protein